MCYFFSFNYCPTAAFEERLMYITAEERRRGFKSPDSHSAIAEKFGVSEDDVFKYELPITYEDIVSTSDFEGFIEKNLKYDGGLPEEDLKYSHYQDMVYKLQDLNWDDLFQAQYPSVFLASFFKERDRGAVIINGITLADYLQKSGVIYFDTRLNQKTSQGQLTYIPHFNGDIENEKKYLLIVSKNKYFDNRDEKIKTRTRIVVSDFEDFTKK